MTLQELNHFFDLQRKLPDIDEMLLGLEEAAVPGAQKLTGMPHASGVRDKVGDLAIEIADLRTDRERVEAEIAEMQPKVEAFIQSIQDVELRTIFRLRFIRGLTWADIGECYRWKYAEGTLRYRVIRYMDRVETG